MAVHTLYGKKLLCYTEVDDFIDIQGIGKDPLYKRYDSVYAVVDKHILEEYKSFLAHPLYSTDEGYIQWYVKDWGNPPQKYSDLDVDEKARYSTIIKETLAVYTKAKENLSGEDRQILTGALKYIDDDFIFCYDDKVTVIAWGMTPDSKKHVIKGAVIHDLKIQTKRKVYFIAGEHGDLKDKVDAIMHRVDGSALGRLDIPEVIPHKGYEFKCWDPEPIGVRITKDLKFNAVYEKLPEEVDPEPAPIPPVDEKVNVRFVCAEGGYISGTDHIQIEKGQKLSLETIPVPVAQNGWIFDGWDLQLDAPILSDTVFTAKFIRELIKCEFRSGDFGSLEGKRELTLPYGTQLLQGDIPNVVPQKGYEFVGWDKVPVGHTLEEDVVFTAQYEKTAKEPWYKRLWAWFTGKGCLKWLLWLLFILLLILLLSQLFKGCDSGMGGIIGGDDVEETEKIETPSGDVIDNNGPVKGIVGEDGALPDNSVVAPIVGDDGQAPPITEHPGAPDVISNRLNIYFENRDVDLEAFAKDLANIYTESQCMIIGADVNIPMIQIKIQETMRDYIRENLNSQLPSYEFFIVDESIFYIKGKISDDDANAGWHLKAIRLKEGWAYTKGDSDVIVAVVDDGIDASHRILKNKIVRPYNVFTQDNHLSHGDGHGTHVAGLAVGSDMLFEKGVSGVAPKCKLMPVQVFDNGMCTFSSITSGIMYAIHNGADVVNVSIGPNFRGLDVLPVSDQDYIAKTQFKNEERVWRRIIEVANEHNSIIVFAVGNDNILASIPPENRVGSTVNVAAISREYEQTDFTNWGRGSNISAPGKGILSSVPVDNFAIFDGTSMAAPIVSGTVALMKSLNEDITVAEVLKILQASGRQISDYIPPMILVDAALQMQKSGVIPEGGNPISEDPGLGGGSFPIQPGAGGTPETPTTGSPGNDQPVSSPVNGNPEPQDPVAGAAGPGSGFNPPAGANPPGTSEPGSGSNPPIGQNPNPGVSPGNDDGSSKAGTDYDAIRRLIEEYKRKISELEKLLPENK